MYDFTNSPQEKNIHSPLTSYPHQTEFLWRYEPYLKKYNPKVLPTLLEKMPGVKEVKEVSHLSICHASGLLIQTLMFRHSKQNKLGCP